MCNCLHCDKDIRENFQKVTRKRRNKTSNQLRVRSGPRRSKYHEPWQWEPRIHQEHRTNSLEAQQPNNSDPAIPQIDSKRWTSKPKLIT